MRRTLRSTAVTFALTATALAVPAAAHAAPAPAPGDISAVADDAPFSGNPFGPGANSTVRVHNGGTEAAKGFFLVSLPKGTELGATDICEQVTKGDTLNWICGGEEVPAGGDTEYLIRVNSALKTPGFGKTALGYVTGRTEDGRLGRRNDFLISWPDQMALRLAVTKGKPAKGVTKVKIKATNTGSFAIGGYALDIYAPSTVRVDDSCSYIPELEDIGCRVTQPRTLPAGATDTFTVTVTVKGGKTPVDFVLMPTQRFTNKDTNATLTLAGDSPAPAPDDTDDAGDTDNTDDPGEGNDGGQGGGTLPITGIDGGTLLIGGTGLVGVGALLLGVTRRRRVTIG